MQSVLTSLSLALSLALSLLQVIVALTESGRTAALISKYRPSVPVLCVTPNEQVCFCVVCCVCCVSV